MEGLAYFMFEALRRALPFSCGGDKMSGREKLAFDDVLDT